MAEQMTYQVLPVSGLPEALAGLGDQAREWFCLVRNGSAVSTPDGIPITHSSRALLEQLRVDAERGANSRLEELSVYSMFCTMKSHTEKARGEDRHCRDLVLRDLTLMLCAGPEEIDQRKRLDPIEEFFSRHRLPRLELSQGLDAEDQAERLIESGLETEMNTVVDFFEALWPTLSSAQQTVVTHCVHIHGAFILGILLAMGECTPAQYAEALLALNCQIPGVFGDVAEEDVDAGRAGVLEDLKVFTQFLECAELPSPAEE